MVTVGATGAGRAATRAIKADVAVIGGGLAGLVAATAAAKAGASVVVLRRGLGGTAMSSGGLDFPAELPPLYGLGRGPGAGARLPSADEAAALLGEWLLAGGVELRGRPGEDLPLLDIAGRVRHTNLAPAQHAAGRVDRWAGRRILFLGLDGFAAFRPEWTKRVAVALGLADAAGAAAASVAPPGLEGQANLPAARLARALEETRNAEVLAARAADEAGRAGADLVALPPVLGLEEAPRVFRAVAAAAGEAGATAFELLSPPPSVPGQRLQRLLELAAEGAGAALVPGRVTGVSEAAGERLLSLSVDLPGRPLTVEASQFILATGKFAAGGLKAQDQVVFEPLFGLAVFGPPPPGWPPGEVPVGGRPVREMVWPRFEARHPVFEAGLAVDGELRPLDERGCPHFANLRAAGSVIGGYNPLTDRAGAGVAVTTGLGAGRLAVAAAGVEGRPPA